MGFSCTIMAGKKDLTKFEGGEIHSQLLNLGPNFQDATDAPYRVDAFRNAVTACKYGDRLKDAAQDCFRALQEMARVNLQSLKEEKHCETCDCPSEEKKPLGWSANAIRKLLDIDPSTITHVSGGY